jgi:ankyrin repeat protein
VTDADGNSVLHLAAASDAATSLQLILRHLQESSYLDKEWSRSLADQRNRFGYTALLIAGEEGFADCCTALINLGGADTTLPLPEAPHLTTTDLALRNGHHEVVNVLRQHARTD